MGRREFIISRDGAPAAGHRILSACACALVLPVLAGSGFAPIDVSANRNPSPLVVDLTRVGTLRPRSADEIRGSNWTLGCECLDRDFADFEQYKDHIVPLGMKEIRLFAGWAKCEREKGVFDFAWLDQCVDWARAHNINVYLDISYGNPIYPGAGGAGLANGIPDTPEGLAAWDRWIEKLGAHYAERIVDYAMWNEPDNGGMNPPAAIADLNVRTARILKRLVPGCRLHGLSLGSLDPELFETCLTEIVKLGGQNLFDTFVYHGYSFNPDTSYETVEKLIEICARIAPKARMRQGENGCPSEWVDFNALSFYPWSENSQAKWDMRRMLGDLGHGCQSTVYTISDLQYKGPHAPYVNLNRKGLLRCNFDREVYAVKKAYYAVQNTVSVFDDTLSLVKDRKISTTDRCLSLYEYRKDGDIPLFVFWDHGHPALRREQQVQVEGQQPAPRVTGAKLLQPERAELPGAYKYLKFPARGGIPSDDFTTRPAAFEWTGTALADPVWVDLFTGAIYAFPKECQIRHSRGITFIRVPVYDSPCVLTERRALEELK